MALDDLVRRGHPVLFGVQLFVTFLELIFTGLVVSHFNDGQSPSSSWTSKARFLLFVSIWSFVLLAVYLVGTLLAAANFLFSIASHTVFLAITWVFWLAGAAAYSAALDGFTCGNNFGVPHCNQIVAAEAFVRLPPLLCLSLHISTRCSFERSHRHGSNVRPLSARFVIPAPSLLTPPRPLASLDRDPHHHHLCLHPLRRR